MENVKQYPDRPRLQCRRGPSAAFIGVLGTPILCVYSGGLNMVPHLAQLAVYSEKKPGRARAGRGPRGRQMRGRFGTPFGILSVYSENEPSLGPRSARLLSPKVLHN